MYLMTRIYFHELHKGYSWCYTTGQALHKHFYIYFVFWSTRFTLFGKFVSETLYFCPEAIHIRLCLFDYIFVVPCSLVIKLQPFRHPGIQLLHFNECKLMNWTDSRRVDNMEIGYNDAQAKNIESSPVSDTSRIHIAYQWGNLISSAGRMCLKPVTIQ